MFLNTRYKLVYSNYKYLFATDNIISTGNGFAFELLFKWSINCRVLFESRSSRV